MESPFTHSSLAQFDMYLLQQAGGSPDMYLLSRAGADSKPHAHFFEMRPAQVLSLSGGRLPSRLPYWPLRLVRMPMWKPSLCLSTLAWLTSLFSL